MRSGGGSIKGGTFERQLCKQLSLWVTNGQRDDCFWRSSMSGGRATLQLRKDIVNLAQSGDMTAIAPEGYELCAKCLFEYKSYKNLQLAQGLFKGIGYLHKFWHDTVKAAEKYNKIPVLIAKQNYFPELLLCPKTCDIFTDSLPIVEVIPWQVSVYLLDEAIRVENRLGRSLEPIEPLGRASTRATIHSVLEAPKTNRKRSVI